MPPVLVKNALIVDANSQLKDLLARVLPKGAWRITYAASNRDAMAAVQERGYDLVITGEKTSAVEDVELLRKVRSVRPHTRLIILTYESTPSAVLDSMRAHAFSLFSAPYREDQLSKMIHFAMESPAWDDGIELISGTTPGWIRIRAQCQESTANRLVQFLNEMSELPPLEREQVGNACREMLMNAIEHGCQLDPQKNVEIEYLRAKHMIACRIADPGPGFTLDEIPHAAIAHSPDDPLRHVAIREELGLRPGGFGILMSKNLVDELIYNQEGNEVLLVKYLKAGTTGRGRSNSEETEGDRAS
jgi:anti-sigma regulatory factor (Ser/Thr protein kinase)/ActR/RegA family two-component response regulator